MSNITIFTPTYNRENKLEDLYHSLLKQTKKDFVWLVIDDGSTDGTDVLVRHWIDEGAIDVRYVYQKNQGKCAGVQKAVEECDTAWMICVDSDDTLREDAVQIMGDDVQAWKDESSIGFIYPQKLGDQEPAWSLPQNIATLDIMDCKNVYGITETAILLRTDVFRKICFPHFEGEKFLSEEVLYIQLAQFGGLIPKKQAFYLSDYLETGITRNLFSHWLRNPRGAILLMQSRFMYSAKYTLGLRIAQRIKCIMNLNALCIACGMGIFENTPSKRYSLCLLLPSLIWRWIRF